MSLVSITFLFFFLCLLIIYYLVPVRFQVYVLAISNIVFYCWAGKKAFPFLIFVCIFSFSMGLFVDWRNRRVSIILSNIEDKQLRKATKMTEEKKLQALTGLAVAILVIGWCTLKIFSSSLPLGLSFYVFIAISYIVDIYREKYEPSRNIVKYSAFMCFFPHLTQGPFSRYDILGTRIFSEHKFNSENIKNGILLIIWGLIKKTVIASRISKMTGTIMVYMSTENSVNRSLKTRSLLTKFGTRSIVATGAVTISYWFRSRFRCFEEFLEAYRNRLPYQSGRLCM